MMKKRYLYILPALAFVFAGCEPSFENEINGDTYYGGDADFSVYVAVGNSLTSGYMDGTMFRSGQQYSFPNILAGQFKTVGGGEFTQPSYEDDVNNVGGLLLAGQPIAPTKMIVNMATGGPENIKGVPTVEVGKLQTKAYHNMGVPGAKVFHLVAPGYGNVAGVANGTANPYFVRHATTPEATVLQDVLSMNPTFFTNWIGANDVLAYATSGGEGVNQAGNPNPATYGSNDITDPMVFGAIYTQIVDALTAGGAKGVVATVPDVTSIPYFTTVPYNPITGSALLTPEEAQKSEEEKAAIIQAKIEGLNTFIGMFKQILAAAGEGDRLQLLAADQANPLLIQDKTLEDMAGLLKMALQGLGLPDPAIDLIAQAYGQARHATSEDLVLLTGKAEIGASAFEPTGNEILDQLNVKGVTYPIGDEFVLNKVEQQEVKEATVAFNNIIRGVAAEKNLAVADMNDILNKAVAGLRVEDGQIYTADYFQGLGNLNKVMFSLDGVHPNARGYAFVAVEILKVINKHYNAKIPLVNPAVYPGPTLLPNNN